MSESENQEERMARNDSKAATREPERREEQERGTRTDVSEDCESLLRHKARVQRVICVAHVSLSFLQLLS